MGTEEEIFEIWFCRSLETVFPTNILAPKDTLSIADKHHHFPPEYYSLMIKYTKFHHPNRCIQFNNKLPRLSCWQAILIFFVTRYDSVSRSCLVKISFLYISQRSSISLIYSKSNEFIF